jgi:capsular polysaccharide biosynthesis protein
VNRPLSRIIGDSPIPQRAVASTTALAQGRPELGIRVEPVMGPVSLERRPAIGKPEHYQAAFDRDLGWHIPERFVATIPDGRVFGSYAAVIAPDDMLLWDLSPGHAPSPKQHPIFRRPRLPAPVEIDGTVAVLSTRGAHNYFHFLLDIVPRLTLLKSAMPLSEVDRFFVDHSTPWQREVLVAAGLPPTSLISPRSTPHVRASQLVVPSLPGSGAQMNPLWAIEALRGLLLGAPAGEGRRIYISRGSEPLTRRVVNEDEVMEALLPLGFELVRSERHTVREQAAMFAGAAVVVAPHGAGLANAIFCSPGATVVEIASPVWLNSTYWRMCCQLPGVDHRFVVGRGKPPRDYRQHNVCADIEVDVPLLLDVLSEVLDRPGDPSPATIVRRLAST